MSTHGFAAADRAAASLVFAARTRACTAVCCGGRCACSVGKCPAGNVPRCEHCGVGLGPGAEHDAGAPHPASGPQHEWQSHGLESHPPVHCDSSQPGDPSA